MKTREEIQEAKDRLEKMIQSFAITLHEEGFSEDESLGILYSREEDSE